MADRKFIRQLWIPLMIGFIFVGLAFWFSSGSDSGRPASDIVDTVDNVMATPGLEEDLSPTEIDVVAVPALRLTSGKRLTINERDLPSEGALSLALDVSDLARGTGRRKARIVSETAGRLETEAVPLPGSASGLRLDISREYLARGLYMIEIETVDSHPLGFRRYVLEIQ